MKKIFCFAALALMILPALANGQVIAGPGAGQVPDYFSVWPNYATSPLRTDSTGAIVGQGMRKFVDTLPGLGSANANNLGQYLPVAVADTTKYPGSDYYEIAAVEFSEQMHSDLPATKLRGYVQIEPPGSTSIPAGSNHVLLPGVTINGQPVYAYDRPHYLGPIVGATRDKPVRVKFRNLLPTGAGGNLFVPVDTTYMGAGIGPNGGTEMFTQNRAAVHLHGGTTPWISDGTPHQWITPATETTSYPQGVSVRNVPDMDGGNEPAGTMTFFYSNQQSARLMFYHDHAYGITRLHVYGGMAAGYLLTDATEQALIAGGTVSYKDPTGTTRSATFTAGTLPDIGIPLVIQDRTFVPNNTTQFTNLMGTFQSQLAAQDPTWDTARWGGFGQLWFPHVYMPNQNPGDLTGSNPMGRWDYGPWFWPPFTGLTYGPIANPYYDPNCVSSATQYCEGPEIPGTPDARLISASGVPESFMDTPVVNGTAYPTLTVDPRPYRFRILNAANDRFFNLSLHQATSIVGGITVTNGGTGYTTAPAVTITPAAGDTTGTGATATATIDPVTGTVTGIALYTVGSGYTLAPTVSILGGGGTGATATAQLYTGQTEVGMVPFNATQNAFTPFPAWWSTAGNPFSLDDRAGGVPDPTKRGPAMIQIATEGGFLPAPTVVKNQPVNYDYNRRSITVLNVLQKALFLGPAERADIVVDFSKFAGKTLILYNDSPAPVPASDPRLDYYTGDPDQTDTGGAPTTPAGYGPNTRTIMQIKVNGSGGTAPADDYNPATLAALQTALPQAFASSQDEIVVPQAPYNAAYNGTFPGNASAYVKIQDTSFAFTPLGTTTPLTMELTPKSIIEDFQMDYGRMNALLGVEIPHTNVTNQTSIIQTYIDPPTEVIRISDLGTRITGVLPDGTQIWKITHNGVDTHAVHVHLYNVQIINRVGWDGALKPPDANELGWKDTVRMNPLEDIIVALRPMAVTTPFKVPNSVRPLDPARPIGSTLDFTNVDPLGNPITVTNQLTNFGWEYVWHCHLLGHEENDMMRAQAVAAPPDKPTGLAATRLNGNAGVRLNWIDNSANETSFTIQRANDAAFSTGLASFTVGENMTTYTDATALVANTYYYRVIASNTVGSTIQNYPVITADSLPSNTATVSPTPVTIVAPANLRAATIATNYVILTWTDRSNNELGFYIERSANNGTTWTRVGQTAANATTFRDNGLTTRTTYQYRVQAFNGSGTSAYSNVLTVTTR
jgi:FtsP/CotA-like multicopper oxidase with cupredoxin domain